MVAFLCMFIPAAVMAAAWGQRKGFTELKEYAITYVGSLVILNGAAFFVLSFWAGNNTNLFDKLNSYNDFALKYLLLSTSLALAVPYIENFVRKKLCVQIQGFHEKSCRVPWRRLGAAYAAILFLLHFIRVFDNNFWGDEIYSILLCYQSVPELLEGTALDVHPPLYYLLLKLACSVFGYHSIVFHSVSVFFYAGVLILALTVVWKQFGKGVAFVLMTMAALQPNAVRLNVEVRMYALGMLFVLLSYLFLRNIFRDQRLRDYVGFVVFSLGGAYTHYYCLVSMAFLYLGLILWSVWYKKRGEWLKVFWACVLTVLGYMPWLFVFLSTLQRRIENDYWIDEIPTVQACISYLFGGATAGNVLACCAGVGTVLFLLYESHLLEIRKNEMGGGKFLVTLNASNATVTGDMMWTLAGWLSVFGTILTGIAISAIVRPLFVTKYLFPVSVISWLLLGVSFTRCKGRRVYWALLVVLCWSMFFPLYQEKYMMETGRNREVSETLEKTADIQAGDIMLIDNTDSYLLKGTVPYYYPDVQWEVLDPNHMPELNAHIQYWMCLFSDINEQYQAYLEDNGYTWKTVVRDKFLGDKKVYLYKIMPSDKTK